VFGRREAFSAGRRLPRFVDGWRANEAAAGTAGWDEIAIGE
jgi:hypothetical protein